MRAFLGGSSAIPDEEWVDSLNINFLSAVRATSAFLPALRESSSGAIINVSSGTSAPPSAPLLHYFAAKTALAQYSRGVAQELASKNIRVNVITPGIVVTPGGDDLRAVFTNDLGKPADQIFKVPLGRMGRPWISPRLQSSCCPTALRGSLVRFCT
jgi:NAD(P)-dependent dehydrogenase (short-subunit alcohol dehydrogenase family)